ncbi:hypothetical protein SDC9_146811 [bioreactor metagenome]|uniref:Uncharacterized protein n=1 Tax=bioreactor metagenome TaxID=1076179 RepID=A0A645EE59_9ZZZZ
MYFPGRIEVILIHQPQVTFWELLFVVGFFSERVDGFAPIFNSPVFETVSRISPHKKVRTQPRVGRNARPEPDPFNRVISKEGLEPA